MAEKEIAMTIAIQEKLWPRTKWVAHAPRVPPTTPRGLSQARHRTWKLARWRARVVDEGVNHGTRGACATLFISRRHREHLESLT